MQGPLPYWSLSTFYFFYFAFLGAWLPYWNLYLEDLGYSANAIGLISAIVLGTKIIAPGLWGWLADHSRRRMIAIRLGTCLGFISFLGIFLHSGLWWIAIIVATYSFFWNAVLAQFEVVTLSHLHGQHHRYTQIRLWGSVGFIVAVALLGTLFDYAPITMLPYLLALLLALLALSSFFSHEARREGDHRQSEPIARIVRKPVFIAFLVACFLMQVSHGPYYTFFSIFLQEHQYSKTLIGWLWGLGVIAEVVLFGMMHRILLVASLRSVMLVTLLLSMLRWLLIAYFVDVLSILIVAQLLHAASFGSFHAVAIEFFRRYFTRGNEGKGQAIYSSASFGAGGAVGALISGWTWDYSASLSFVIASAFCAAALILCWFWVRGNLVEHDKVMESV